MRDDLDALPGNVLGWIILCVIGLMFGVAFLSFAIGRG